MCKGTQEQTLSTILLLRKTQTTDLRADLNNCTIKHVSIQIIVFLLSPRKCFALLCVMCVCFLLQHHACTCNVSSYESLTERLFQQRNIENKVEIKRERKKKRERNIHHCYYCHCYLYWYLQQKVCFSTSIIIFGLFITILFFLLTYRTCVL